MRHLSAADVDRLLPPAAAVQAARAGAAAQAAGLVATPDRTWHAPDGMPGMVGVMPAHVADDGDDPAIFTTKVVGVFPDATPSVNGLIGVLDATSGAPLATVDAAAVTAARTAAHSGLSIDLLARPEAGTVAVLGAGVQGWAHLRAAMAVRPIERVRVWNRSPERAQTFAARAAGLPGVTSATAHPTPGDAARGADVVCACTNAATAILGRDDVAPGTHVTAIGAFTPDTRELAADLLARADVLVVDDVAAAGHEAGDLLMAVREGMIDPRDLDGDLIALVSGGVPHRRPGDVTVYKSVGTSAQDVTTVRALLAADAATRLAVYGTLGPGQPNADVLAAAGGTWARGTVRGTRLDDGWHGYPGLVLDPDGPPVEVDVVDDPGLDLAALDTFEGPGYRRRRTVVHLEDGTATTATVYVLADPTRAPSP